jgi:CheY-like chemotaxis protein
MGSSECRGLHPAAPRPGGQDVLWRCGTRRDSHRGHRGRYPHIWMVALGVRSREMCPLLRLQLLAPPACSAQGSYFQRDRRQTAILRAAPSAVPATPGCLPGPRFTMSTPTSGVSDRRRVLVVDDEAVLRSLIARGFRDRGYEVIEVADGLSALDAARSTSVAFSLVVTNNRMPHLDGPHLATCLRELDPTLPIIHISGNMAHGTRPCLKGFPPFSSHSASGIYWMRGTK